MKPATDGAMYFERYEMKYLIPLEKVEPIRRYIRAFCEEDPWSARSPDGYYHVNTLYLDTPRFRFLETRRIGANNKFNMRIRGYGDPAGPPWFMEVKNKNAGFVQKYRAMAPTCDVQDWLDQSGGTDRNGRLFQRLALTHRVEPKILTHYRRNAWVSRLDDYARVTFDRDLSYTRREHYNLVAAPRERENYDNAGIFPEGCSVVLELKSSVQVPVWMLDLIRNFELMRTAFSKYTHGYGEVEADLMTPAPLRQAVFSGVGPGQEPSQSWPV